MHDPLVVAFAIQRPWPQRSTFGWYWPSLVTVWHREPKGHDSGEICKRHTRRFHVWHWKIQIHSLQELRRRLLTRCAWCGGRSTKRDPVNHSHSWDGVRSRWWRGEIGLYHDDCSGVSTAHAACLCDDPLTGHIGYGTCAICGKQRSYGVSDRRLAIHRGLAEIPAGKRDRDHYDAVCNSEDKGSTR